jgi:hypothetical protein
MDRIDKIKARRKAARIKDEYKPLLFHSSFILSSSILFILSILLISLFRALLWRNGT